MKNAIFTHGYALLIGVGNDLPVTVQDANVLQRILLNAERCGYPQNQVMLLTEGRASRQGILDGFDWLSSIIQHDSTATAIIYFSGHGGFFPHYHLVPFDYDSQSIEETCISGDDFKKLLQNIQAQKLLILLDCCHAAGMTSFKSPNRSFEPSSFPPQFHDILTKGSGNVLIASSRKDERSYIGQSYSEFTQALIEGFVGYGTSERDGYAYVADIALYVGRIVPQRTDEKQHPILDLQGADNFAVAYYAGGEKAPKPLPHTQIPISLIIDTFDEELVRGYKEIIKRKKRQLLDIETQIARVYDQAAISPDLIRIREDILKEIAEKEAEIRDMSKNR